MSTEENLTAAFSGESQANRRYTAFARRAEEEGLPSVAKLFRATAEAETVHALNHLRAMGTVGNTEENLRAAIEGETYEFTEMYPAFIGEAESDGSQQALISFQSANAVEKVHASLYKKALENLDSQGDVSYFVCGICGHTVQGSAPDTCPVCQASKAQFKEIE